MIQIRLAAGISAPMWSLQHLPRHTPMRQHGAALARSPSPNRSAAIFSPMPFLPVVQAKLHIGASNDKSEQEADRVADQVMRMADQGPTRPVSLASSDMAQRRRLACQASGRCDTRVTSPLAATRGPFPARSAHSSSRGSVATSVMCVCIQMRPPLEALNRLKHVHSPSDGRSHLLRGNTNRRRIEEGKYSLTN